MVGLDGQGVGQQMKEGEEPLVPLLVRGTTSEEEDGPLKLGVSEGVELVLTEATALQPWGGETKKRTIRTGQVLKI
jgi:hypothetical protein